MNDKKESKDATIIRSPRNAQKPYFATARSAAQHRGMSFEARGLLWYLLSKPDDWTIRGTDIRKEGGIGESKLKRLIKELKDNGYLVTERLKDDEGKFIGAAYRVYEEAQTISMEIHPMEKPSGGKTTPLQIKEVVTDKRDIQIGDKSQKAKAEPPQTPSLLDESTMTQILHAINSGQSSTVENLLSFYSTDEEQLWHTLVEMEKRALIDLDGVTRTAYPRGTMVKPEITLDDFSTYVPDFSHKHSLKFTDVKEALLEAFKVQGEGTREHSLAAKTANELIAAQVHADEVQSLYDFVSAELKKMGTTLFKVSALPNHVTQWRVSEAAKKASPAQEATSQGTYLEMLGGDA